MKKITLDEQLIHQRIEERRENIIAGLKGNGFDSETPISISYMRKNHPKLYYSLTVHASKTVGTQNVTSLLEHLGWKTAMPTKINKDEVVKEKFVAELKQIYTPEAITQFIEGKAELPTIRQLRKKTKYAYRYSKRAKKSAEFPPIRGLLNSLYPEYPHLSYNLSTVVKLEDISVDDVSKKLKDMYYKGEDISCAALAEFEKGFYLAWLTAYALESHKTPIGINERKRDVTSLISKLTKIKPANFSTQSSKSKKKRLATISENLARLVLLSSYSLDSSGVNQTEKFRQVFPTPISNVYFPRGTDKHLRLEKRPRKDDDPLMYPDLLVESFKGLCMVEVKWLMSSNNTIISEILERFAVDGKRIYWPQGKRDVTQKTLITLCRKEVCSELSDALSNTEINMINANEFRDCLETALTQTEKSGYVRTHVYSADEILKMYDVLVNSPHILIRPGHAQQFEFFDSMTKELIDRLQKGTNVLEIKPVQLFGRPGEIKENSKGKYEVFTIDLDDVPSPHIKPYLRSKAHLIPKDALFMDIESTGFQGNTIFLIGTMSRPNGNIQFELAFARNYLEEPAVLQYYCEKAASYRQIITYNGASFDYPSINERLAANMMPLTMPENHLDLYDKLRAIGLDKKLQSRKQKKHYQKDDNKGPLKLHNLAYALFGEQRHDVHGKEVPLIFYNWCAYGNPCVIKKNLEHNVLDILTTGAIFCSQNELESLTRYHHRII